MAGDRGIVLKTTDGGETWQTTKLNENWYITQIDFIDDSVGWAVGYHNILKTEDGGYNWVLQKKVPDFYLYSIYAVDKNNVYAAYDKIYKTTNGGADWIDVSPKLSDRSYRSIWFSDPETGVVVGGHYKEPIREGIILSYAFIPEKRNNVTYVPKVYQS